ncbi:hypothetical protein COB52_06085 [Candidatus Kaiserbacteria bacterium]|nr:MAG: hypothetical protein COB52_06085 [Candidatus Kaiserbacteria bacterium]
MELESTPVRSGHESKRKILTVKGTTEELKVATDNHSPLKNDFSATKLNKQLLDSKIWIDSVNKP